MDELLANLDDLVSHAIRVRLDARIAAHPGRTVGPAIRSGIQAVYPNSPLWIHTLVADDKR